MNKTLTFGIISGLFWSVAPLVLGENMGSLSEIVSVLISGILTGIIITSFLSTILPLRSKNATAAFGLLALPAGAFVFGVILTVCMWLLRAISGSIYRYSEGFNPIENGLNYAVASFLTVFAFAFIPLAIMTTFILNNILKEEQDVGGYGSK